MYPSGLFPRYIYFLNFFSPQTKTVYSFTNVTTLQEGLALKSHKKKKKSFRGSLGPYSLKIMEI